MELTLAVCTWNRAARLRRLLESVAAAAPPPAPWEVLVVDNNSTDETAAVAADFTARLPLRRVFESRQGSAPARNRVLAEAKGNLVVFTDDDTTIDPGFLTAYTAAAIAHPAVSFFGGAIRARFEEPEPRWVHFDPRTFTTVFAELSPDPERLSVDAEQLPYGANFAVRRACVRAERFDETLGVQGKRRINGEDSLFLWRLLARGEPGRWLPEAIVYHWIPPAMATPGHLVRYFVATGRGGARLRRRGHTASYIAPERRAVAVAGTAAAHLLHAGIRRAIGLPSWVGHLRLASTAFGELLEIAGAPA